VSAELSTSSRRLLPLSVFAVGTASLATPFGVLGMLCLWVLVARVMPGNTWIRRLLLALVVIHGSVVVVLTACAVLDRPCHPRWTVAALLFIACACGLRDSTPGPCPGVSREDVLAVGFGTMTFGALATPLLMASPGKVMALMSQTTDGATHVQLVTAIYRAHGFVQLAPPAGLSPGASQYPTGWHGNVWLLSEFLLGSEPSATALVRLVAVVAIATYALLCVIAAAFLFDVAAAGRPVGFVPAAFGLLALALTAVVGFGIFFVQLASYTQVMAIALILAVLLIGTTQGSPVAVTAVGSAGLIGVAHSWYLLVPLVVAAVAVVLLARQDVSWRPLATLGVMTVPFCLYPILTGPSPRQVDLGGPIQLPTLPGLLALLAATALACAFLLRKHRSESGRAGVTITVLSLLGLVVLILKQGYVAGSAISYYGAKLLLTVLLLGCLLAAAQVVVIASRGECWRALVPIALLAGGVWSTASYTLPPRTAHYEGHVQPEALTAMFARYPRGLPSGTQVWALDGCDRVGDGVTTKWLYDTSLGWTQGLADDVAAYMLGPPGDVTAVQRQLERADVRQVELFVMRECSRGAVAALLKDAKVTVHRVR
jgi:hypothetical protein